MRKTGKGILLAFFGLTVYLAAESLHPAEFQPSARGALALIDLYQTVGRPCSETLGFSCRYTPSCSEYARQAIAHYGTLRGGARMLGRLWRCAPWGGQGYDPAVAARDRSGN